MQRQVCFQLLTWPVSQTSVNTTDKQLPLKGQYWHDLEWFAKNQGRYSSTKLQNFTDVYMVEEGGNIVSLKETVTLNGHWQTSQVHQFCKALYSAILVNHYSWNGRFPNMKKKVVVNAHVICMRVSTMPTCLVVENCNNKKTLLWCFFKNWISPGYRPDHPTLCLALPRVEG